MFGSPSAYLLWSLLTCFFLAYLIIHLWKYDEFKCLCWHGGQRPGTFKRVMVYSYLGTLNLLVVYSVGATVIKFREGYFVLPSGEVIYTPISLWAPEHRRWLLPLYLVLSAAWGLEHVTHLEELAFWLFILNQGPRRRDWFHSWEFRAWCTGSVLGISGMLITAFVASQNIYTCLSWIFLIGALGGTSTTLVFLYVLVRFPSFLLHVQSEGAAPDVVIRLATFYQLNRIRVFFRFVFTLPLVCIGCDGINPPYIFIGRPFVLDFLLMLSSIACFISSALTLVIFFPRPIMQEYGHKEKNNPSIHSRTSTSSSVPPVYYSGLPASSQSVFMQHTSENLMWASGDLNSLDHSFCRGNSGSRGSSARCSMGLPYYPIPCKLPNFMRPLPSLDDTVPGQESKASSLTRRYSDSYFEFYDRYSGWKSSACTASSEHPLRQTTLHPYVSNYRSPIDLMDSYDEFHIGSKEIAEHRTFT